MTAVEQQRPWKPEATPLSYWNIPNAAKTTQNIGESLTGSGPGMATAVSTPIIQQLFDPSDTKCLPGKGSRGGSEFVNWGTKLYQLELELSYKNNEVAVMQKKLKRFADELYPSGNTLKKSVVATLKDQCEVMKRKLENKERQLKWEQKRCKGLEHDLADFKKQNLALRRQNLVNDKGTQTVPDNNKQTQANYQRTSKATRSVLTQCSPTTIKVTNSTSVTSTEPRVERPSNSSVKPREGFKRKRRVNIKLESSSSKVTTSSSTSMASSLESATSFETQTRVVPRQGNPACELLAKNVTVKNKVKVEVVPTQLNSQDMSPSSKVVVPHSKNTARPYTPSKPGVKFATAMTIKEDPTAAKKKRDPLEMSITQEFGRDNAVKTVVQSNRDFKITEKPMVVSHPDYVTPVSSYGSIDANRHGKYLLKATSPHTDGDSGYEASDGGTPTFRTRGVDVRGAMSNKLSYKQILDGATTTAPEIDISSRVYEQNVHTYMQAPPPSSIRPSPPMKNYPHASQIVTSPFKYDTSFFATPREIYQGNTVTNGPGAMIPYRLFRRTDRIERNRNEEKPIFVHVSEITMGK